MIDRVLSQSFARAKNKISKYSHPRNKLLTLKQRENSVFTTIFATQPMQKMFQFCKNQCCVMEPPKYSENVFAVQEKVSRGPYVLCRGVTL